MSIIGNPITLGGAAAPSTNVASGEFTLANFETEVTLNHNLDSNKILVVMQRVNADHSVVSNTSADSRYRSLSYIGATVELIAYDTLQGYQFDGGNIVYFYDNDVQDGYPNGIRAFFPASNGTTMPAGETNRPPRIGVVATSSNAVKVAPGYLLFPGRWVWRAYKC